MDIATASTTLAVGRIPEQWPVVAAMLKDDLSNDQLATLNEAIDAFIARMFCQLEALRDRLTGAGFQFALPDYHLRAATPHDIRLLDSFIEHHGAVPLSVVAWYRRVASFTFAQAGSQMFDRSHGFYFMNRFHVFTMPPIATACSSRWDDMIGWEGDDHEVITDDDKVFFMMEEAGMDEDWKGFELPLASVDPIIDPETGMTFLQWAAFQTKWGGFGALPRAIEEQWAGEINGEVLNTVFRA